MDASSLAEADGPWPSLLAARPVGGYRAAVDHRWGMTRAWVWGSSAATAIVVVVVVYFASKDVRDRLTAVAAIVGALGTGAAAVAALIAARSSQEAARGAERAANRTERALALHFQPRLMTEMHSIDFTAPPPAPGSHLAYRQFDGDDVRFDFRNANQVPIDHVQVRWVDDLGQVRSVEIGPTADGRYQARLAGRTIRTVGPDPNSIYPGAMRLREPVRATIMCRDGKVGRTWSADVVLVTAPGPGMNYIDMELQDPLDQ